MSYTETKIYKSLTKRFGPVEFNQILTLFEIVSENFDVEITENDKENFETLMKWGNANYDKIWPIIQKNITIRLKDGSFL